MLKIAQAITPMTRGALRALWAGLCLIGIGIGMIMNANAQIVFNLKPAAHYFGGAASIALLQAALRGDLAGARQLVASGANPNDEGPAADANRLRLLHYAIASNNKEAVKVLVAVGADPALDASGGGADALLFAVTLNNVDMLSLLLDLRPVKSLSRETLEYLMFESVTQGRPRCLELLLQRGAPIDLLDDAGYTVLMRAFDSENFDLAEHLLLRGASANIETSNGVSPAYQVQRMLARLIPGSPSHRTLERIKALMLARGISFPVPSPKEVRAQRAGGA